MRMGMGMFLWVVVGLGVTSCALAQKANKARPNIVYQDNSLIMVMNSANITIRNLENKERVEASYITATISTPHEDKTNMTAVMDFTKPDVIGGDLKITSFTLKMDMVKEGGYWVMKNATADLSGTEKGSAFGFTSVMLISEIGMYAPETWSFHCSRFGPLYPAISGGNHTFTLDLLGFQIQPFTTNTKSFGEAYECVGFFSIGILSGIFVTLILLAVLTWGLYMIMDVKTMDRFDDPKGKPVSFGGTE